MINHVIYILMFGFYSSKYTFFEVENTMAI